MWSDSFLYPNKQITLAGTSLKVFVAESSSEVAQGLSGRHGLRDGEGMLFIFGNPSIQTFWMQDMLFDIDMIFIRDNIIVDIAKNMPKPKPYEWPATYSSKNSADMVLEVNSGLSDRNGWEVGDSINYQN